MTTFLECHLFHNWPHHTPAFHTLPPSKRTGKGSMGRAKEQSHSHKEWPYFILHRLREHVITCQSEAREGIDLKSSTGTAEPWSQKSLQEIGAATMPHMVWSLQRGEVHPGCPQWGAHSVGTRAMLPLVLNCCRLEEAEQYGHGSWGSLIYMHSIPRVNSDHRQSRVLNSFCVQDIFESWKINLSAPFWWPTAVWSHRRNTTPARGNRPLTRHPPGNRAWLQGPSVQFS